MFVRSPQTFASRSMALYHHHPNSNHYNPKNNLYAEGFLSENFDLKFPKDHNAHYDFKTEWWYITANLKNTNGDLFGIQWTLFRNKSDLSNLKSAENIRNPWISNQLWMAHAVVTSKKNHFFHTRIKNTIETRSSCTLFLDSILENESQEGLLGHLLGFI